MKKVLCAAIVATVLGAGLCANWLYSQQRQAVTRFEEVELTTNLMVLSFADNASRKLNGQIAEIRPGGALYRNGDQTILIAKDAKKAIKEGLTTWQKLEISPEELDSLVCATIVADLKDQVKRLCAGDWDRYGPCVKGLWVFQLLDRISNAVVDGLTTWDDFNTSQTEMEGMVHNTIIADLKIRVSQLYSGAWDDQPMTRSIQAREILKNARKFISRGLLTWKELPVTREELGRIASEYPLTESSPEPRFPMTFSPGGSTT